MATISFTEFQKNPGAIFELLDKSHEPIRITRKGKKAFVLLSEDDMPGLKETAYLLSSPENARRLKEAEDDFHNGKKNYRKHTLIEE